MKGETATHNRFRLTWMEPQSVFQLFVSLLHPLSCDSASNFLGSDDLFTINSSLLSMLMFPTLIQHKRHSHHMKNAHNFTPQKRLFQFFSCFPRRITNVNETFDLLPSMHLHLLTHVNALHSMWSKISAIVFFSFSIRFRVNSFEASRYARRYFCRTFVGFLKPIKHYSIIQHGIIR